MSRGTPTLAVVAVLAVVALAGAAPARGASAETSGDEIYKLAKDALGRGSFETAVRLFRVIGEEARFDGDSRFAFNHAQASRFAGNAGEAVYWYARYLALTPSAPDAATVRADVAKLAQTSPKSVRAEALKRARAEYARVLADAELARALRECARVRLTVRFRRGKETGEPTSYLFYGRAVLFELSDETDAPSAVWVSADEPIDGPDDGPPLLLIPPGRPFRLPLASDIGGGVSALAAPQPSRFPPDPALKEWTLEMAAELDRTGPALLLAPAAPAAGEVLAEVRSAASEPTVAVGKKRRELPVVATSLAFGPRATAPDAKTFAAQRVFVVELAGKDGSSQRWAAPPSAFTVVNAFARRSAASGPERISVRADGSGPFLTTLPTERR